MAAATSISVVMNTSLAVREGARPSGNFDPGKAT
jgi:hypothetical protein